MRARAFAALLLALPLAAVQPKAQAPSEPPRMLMAVGTQRYMVTLQDNPTAQALSKMLPVTFEMTDLNDNEKKARLPRGLPTKSCGPEPFTPAT